MGIHSSRARVFIPFLGNRARLFFRSRTPSVFRIFVRNTNCVTQFFLFLKTRLNTSQITAAPGSDYTPQDINLQFPPGDTSKTVDIKILNDLVIEGTETFRVTITSDDAQVKILEPQSITVTIIDTDGRLFMKSKLYLCYLHYM